MIPPCPGGGTERVFVSELSAYLYVGTARVRRFAIRRRLMHRQRMRGSIAYAEFVTKYGALCIIAHFRRMQGALYQQGEQYNEDRERMLAKSRAQSARDRERASTQNPLAIHAQNMLAFSSAEAEAESAERSGGKDDSGIVGNPGGVIQITSSAQGDEHGAT